MMICKNVRIHKGIDLVSWHLSEMTGAFSGGIVFISPAGINIPQPDDRGISIGHSMIGEPVLSYQVVVVDISVSTGCRYVYVIKLASELLDLYHLAGVKLSDLVCGICDCTRTKCQITGCNLNCEGVVVMRHLTALVLDLGGIAAVGFFDPRISAVYALC